MICVRILSYVAIFLCVSLPLQGVAGNGGAYTRYLRPPTVTWQDDLITGDLKNVPVQGIVEDLLRAGGYEWDVEGSLNGQISISLDGLTVAESLHRILKRSDANFAMIQADTDPTDKGLDTGIEKLTIYQKDGYVRFLRTSRKINASKNIRQRPAISKTRTSTVKRPSKTKPSPAAPANRPSKSGQAKVVKPPPDMSPEDRAMMDKELKSMLDDMLTENQITDEEYHQLLEELDTLEE